jgi:6-pyruvoyltetrahydropterin/6-carboxytetrahydropterin synthase
MYVVSRDFEFSAAHRVEGHPKCGRLHGHNYLVTVEIYSDIIPSDGMLVDYGAMKQIVQPLIDAMDHRYIVSISNMHERDPYALLAMAKGDAFELGQLASTAELIAHHLHDRIMEALETAFPGDTDLEVAVEVQETTKTAASFWR